MAKTFGSLARDDNRVPIMTGDGFQTQDATGTPQTSPLTVPAQSSSITTITIPTSAAEMVMVSDVNLRISEESTVADRYFVLPAAYVLAVSVANRDVIYLAGDSAEATVSFYFVLVDND